MKTGQCKFGDKCKFHHPLDRSAVGSDGKKQTVKLTLAGLPRREVPCFTLIFQVARYMMNQWTLDCAHKELLRLA